MFDDLIKKVTDNLWNYHVKKRYGLPNASHLSLQYDRCDMILWDKADVPYFEDGITIPKFESVVNEYLNAENKRTTVIPKQWEKVDNIIVDVGLVKIAKGEFGSGDSGINYLFGSNATGEDPSDDSLGTQVLAKSFDSAGDKATIDAQKTSKYLMPVTSADYTGDIKEAGLATGNNPPSTGVLITHYTFPTVTVSSPSLLTAITTALYRNGTVT